MNRKRRIGLIGLMLAISMCAAWASWAQTQNPAPPSQSDGVEELVSGVSAGRGSRFEGLGDEASANCSPLPRYKDCGVCVRKGKVTFTFLVQPAHQPSDTDLKVFLEVGKRLAELALTVDDQAMKSEN
jgi:hypothetical protein